MEGSPAELAMELMKRGVKNVIITDGSNPIIIGSNNAIEEVKVNKLDKIVSANGAGDALFAGILHGLHNSMSLKEAVEFGTKMSALALQTTKAVNPDVINLVSEEVKKTEE